MNRCAGCDTEMPATLLACPSCQRLARAEELKGLAASATLSEKQGSTAEALAGWRRALDLLPPGSVQHQRITEQIARLSAILDKMPLATRAATPPAPSVRHRYGWLGVAAVIGAFLFKFKWVVAFLLTKGKLLLVGLAQGKTFLSMAAALGVYASVHGWKFAVGLIVSLYVHEMGHVAWLRRYGIAATAPMFIPGLGAFVRLKQLPATPGEDARVGLAGPVWGAAAALFFLAGGLLAGWPSWLATARVGAWINLFNLLPVWQLDGGRAFRALSRRQRGLLAAALWALALLGGDGLLFAVAAVATVRALPPQAPPQGDRPVFWTYLVLAIAFTLLMTLVPLAPASSIR